MFSTAVSTMLTMVMTAAKISSGDMSCWVVGLFGCWVASVAQQPNNLTTSTTSLPVIHHHHRVPCRLRVVIRRRLNLVSNHVEIAVTAREDATAIRQVVDL